MLPMGKKLLGSVAALGLCAATTVSALTVSKDMPTVWLPNGTTGTGATLGIFDLPGGGRSMFFSYFANDDAGDATWVSTNMTTTAGQNVFADLSLRLNTGGSFNPTASVDSPAVGTATFTFNSCDSLTVEYALDAGGTGTIDFASALPNPACVWNTNFGESACPAFAVGTDADIPGSCVLPATLNQSVTLTNDHHWVIGLNGFRFGDDLGVSGGDSQVLTIEPGTMIIGDTLPAGSQDLGAFASISRGNQIVAVGTAEAPIVFTSKSHFVDGALGSGQWGGLIIAGRSTVNNCDPAVDCIDEVQLNNYGGSNEDDSSGELRYVRLEYAGTEISALSELNGLSLYAVGSGTTIENIHVHRNGDDGIEWFGGNANARYALITDVDDDSFDWTEGARHKVQYGVARMTEAALKDARGFEGDGLQNNEGASPRSAPKFSNITVYYEAGISEGPQQGLRLRRGTLGNYTNMVVTSAAGDLAPSDCLRIDGPQSNQDAGPADNLTGLLTMTNTVLACQGNLFDDNEPELLESEFFNNQAGNTTDSADLTGNIDGAAIGSSTVPLIPSLTSPAANIGTPPADLFGDFFDKVNYAGAFAPGASTDWTAGEWTNVEPDDSL